jgi:Anti-sigma-28 factor, FlgM
MSPINPGTPLADADRDRLYMIKRAIEAGTYHISADDVAAKLILTILELDDGRSLSETTSSSETEVDGLPADEKRG